MKDERGRKCSKHFEKKREQEVLSWTEVYFIYTHL